MMIPVRVLGEDHPLNLLLQLNLLTNKNLNYKSKKILKWLLLSLLMNKKTRSVRQSSMSFTSFFILEKIHN